MKTKTKEAIKAKLAVADEYAAKNDHAAVEKILSEVEALKKADESSERIEAARKSLGGPAPHENDVAPETALKPVTQEELADYLKNMKGAAAYNSSFEPAGYIKSLSPALQPKWIRDAMGSNLVERAEHYKSTWLKWFRSRRELDFYKTADDAAIKAMQENTDAEGGYFVPEEYRTTVIHNTGAPFGIHRPWATQFTTGLKDGYMPTMGSVSWTAIAEEAAYSDNTPTVGQVAFTVRKSGGSSKVSAELLEDSQANVPALLGQVFGEASGRYEDQQIIEGDGSTEPEGLRTTATDGTDSAANNAVAIGDILQWYYDLPAQFRANGKWSVSSSFMAKVAALQVTANKGDLSQAPDEFLLGKAVGMFDGTGWDDAAAVAADEELGAFGDFRNYYLIDRIGMTLRRDDSIYVESDQVGFFARRRFDGRVGLADAFRILKIAT